MNRQAYLFWSNVSDWIDANSLTVATVQLALGLVLAAGSANEVHDLYLRRLTLVPENFRVVEGRVKSPTMTVDHLHGKHPQNYYDSHFTVENQPGSYSYFLGSRSPGEGAPTGLSEGQTVSCAYYTRYVQANPVLEHSCEELSSNGMHANVNRAISRMKSYDTFFEALWYVQGSFGVWLMFIGGRRLLRRASSVSAL